MGTRRIRSPSSLSQERTQALSDFILAWKEGDAGAAAHLTPWLRREIRRQIHRLIESSERGARIDANHVIDATLRELAAGDSDPGPRRVHLLAAAAPVFRRVLVEALRRRGQPLSMSHAMFDGEGRVQVDLLELDRALDALAEQDPEPARMAELRLFGAMPIADVAEVLSLPEAIVRDEWNLARAWIHRRVGGHERGAETAPLLVEPARWARTKATFQSVLAKAPSDRSAHLAQICADERLRADVEALIQSHDQAAAVFGTHVLQRREPRQQEEFPGTDRFRLEQRLGSGAFGVVYRAFDRKRNRVVALKTLSPTNSDALYRLKREFRSLTDLSHPNLVRLHELFSEGSVWFFTMDLIEGVNFLDFVRPVGRGSVAALDEARLRAALVQLVEGVFALHLARRLHRDLKPSNVLVGLDGRLRILDFGLITELWPPPSHQSSRIAGTPAYMAPEQGTREPLTEASDWYSVGTMLYEALTGTLPFTGGFLDILMEKRASAAPSPLAAAGASVPRDLDQLCTALLQPDPSKRPAGRDLLLGLQSQSPTRLRSGPHRVRTPFVGRQKDLEDLRAALSSVLRGRTTVVTVLGPSGIGKTALVRAFLEDLSRDEPAIPIFKARCYEQESVPFKALDGIVDSMAGYLKRLSPSHGDALLPRDILALARLFPALKQVPAVAAARRRVLDVVDTQEVRRRAFGALRELLARLGDQTVPVLFIDDVHWGDVDSAVLLAELLHPPDPPSLLLVATYRAEEAETSPFLRHILPLRALAGSAVDLRELRLGTIPPDDATELAQMLLGSQWPESAIPAAAIARESGGNPFLVDEMARYETMRRRMGDAKGRAPGRTRKPLRFHQMIRARLAQLPRSARHVLEAVCLAGQPVEETIVERVAGLRAIDSTVLDALKQERFVRTRVGAEATVLEPYHDRIREAVLRRLSASAARTYHGALAREMLASGHADPDVLAFHFEAAGDTAQAADYALRAADRALESLAFEHAARLYSVALRLGAGHIDERRVLTLLADSLANGGRGADAAPHYLEAARQAHGLEAHELRRRATQQLLTSGHIQAGMKVMDALVRGVGMKMPASRGRAVASLVWDRALLVLRGTRFRRRAEAAVPPERLVRLDTCWTVTVGLMFVHPLTALMFQARHLRLALKVGEPYRLARALALEAGFRAAAGAKKGDKAEALLRQARALSQDIANPHALAVTTGAEGFVRYFEGRWSRALEILDAASAMLREHCTGVAWEMHAAQLHSLWSLYHLGHAREIERRLEPLLQHVRRRRDLFLEACLNTGFLTFLAVARDDPRLAREQLDRISELRLDDQFTVQHFWDLDARVLVALYEGNGEEALQAMRSGSREFTQSGAARIQQNRIFNSFFVGQSAIVAALKAGPDARARLLRQAEANAGAVQREGAPWGMGMFHVLKAGLDISAGDRAGAVAQLLAAQQAFEAAESVGLIAMAGRLRCGELMGGPEGDRMAAEARSWFTGQGFARPDRIAAVYVAAMNT